MTWVLPAAFGPSTCPRLTSPAPHPPPLLELIMRPYATTPTIRPTPGLGRTIVAATAGSSAGSTGSAMSTFAAVDVISAKRDRRELTASRSTG